MMKGPVRVAFFGSRPLGVAALSSVIKFMNVKGISWIDLSVLTSSDDRPPNGVVVWWKLGFLRKLALSDLRIHVLSKAEDILSKKIDLVTMVFHNEIIPPQIIDSVPRGITNIHFGYLPTIGYDPKTGSSHRSSEPYSRGTYRGSNILTHAILNGEKWQAVTFHFITKKIDLGPVIEYAWNPIGPTTTAWDLQIASEKKGLSVFEKYFSILVERPASIQTLAARPDTYRYFDRQSLTSLNILDPKIKDKELDLLTRAFAFPNTEPAYFVDNIKGKKYKRYVYYKKSIGPVFKNPRQSTYLQRLSDLQ